MQTVGFFFQASCLFTKSHKCKQKIIRHFHTPSIFTIMNCGGLKIFFGNRKLQKTWLVTLSWPLAAILNFTQKCKQTAVSQKLSKIKIFFSRHFLHLIRYLNYWDNKNFWGAKSGPLTHASSVNHFLYPWFYHLLGSSEDLIKGNLIIFTF